MLLIKLSTVICTTTTTKIKVFRPSNVKITKGFMSNFVGKLAAYVLETRTNGRRTSEFFQLFATRITRYACVVLLGDVFLFSPSQTSLPSLIIPTTKPLGTHDVMSQIRWMQVARQLFHKRDVVVANRNQWCHLFDLKSPRVWNDFNAKWIRVDAEKIDLIHLSFPFIMNLILI